MVCRLLLALFLSTALGFVHCDVSRVGAVGEPSYAVSLNGTGGVAWTGHSGVWKMGSWKGTQNPARLAAMANVLVSKFPSGHTFTPKNASSYTVVTLQLSENTTYVFDTRHYYTATWLQSQESFRSALELQLEDVVWDNDGRYPASSVQLVRFVYGDEQMYMTLSSNGSATLSLPDKPFQTAHATPAHWADVARQLTETIQFFATEQFPLQGDQYIVSIVYDGDRTHELRFSSNATDEPARLKLLTKLLFDQKDQYTWNVAGGLMDDRGKNAAIACAVVFGVLTLALIAVALLRYNQRQQKVVPADQAIEHALSVYDNEFDEDEELFG